MSPAEALLDDCVDALARAGESDAEIFVTCRQRGAARFALSELREHMGFDEVSVRVRVAAGARVAEVTTNDREPEGLIGAIVDAARLARIAPPTDGFPGFSGPGEPTPPVHRFAARTAALTDAERADIAAEVLARIDDAGLTGAGIVSSSVTLAAVATTAGCRRHHASTTAEARVWALTDAEGRGASGHAAQLHRDVGALRVDEVTAEAIRFAEMGRSPGHVDAGRWDVVMEPLAVAELLEWFGMIAFGAPDFERGKGTLSGRIGQAVTGSGITIREAPLEEGDLGFGAPFDHEGTPRRTVDLIRDGVAKGVLYDRVHAARRGVGSTGSALPPEFGAPGGVGPVALHLSGMNAESATDLTRTMKRGLYVRRLHYVNGFVEPRRAVMTGLTRDGCFLVEDGRIRGPVGNVRFTDSFLEMLARADAMTRDRFAVSSAWSAGSVLVVPAVRFRDVAITSGSRR